MYDDRQLVLELRKPKKKAMQEEAAFMFIQKIKSNIKSHLSKDVSLKVV